MNDLGPEGFAGREQTRKRTLRVLVVDDEIGSLSNNARRVESAGHKAITCLLTNQYLHSDRFSRSERQRQLNREDAAISRGDHYKQYKQAFFRKLQSDDIGEFDVVVTDSVLSLPGESGRFVTGNDIIDWVKQKRGAHIRSIVTTDAIDPIFSIERGNLVEQSKRLNREDYPSADGVVTKQDDRKPMLGLALNLIAEQLGRAHRV